MSTTSKLNLRLKKINPKNKKKLKFYKNIIKVQKSSSESDYKRNWYMCNEEFEIDQQDVESLIALFEAPDTEVCFIKDRSLFIQSLNRFYLHGYKKKKMITSVLQMEQLCMNIYKTSFVNNLKTSLTKKSNFTISFISEDKTSLYALSNLLFFEKFDFMSIYQLNSDFFLREANIYCLDDLLNLLENKEFNLWFLMLKKISGLCLISFNLYVYELHRFLNILYYLFYWDNTYVLKENIEDFSKQDFNSLVMTFSEDPDNILYKNFESDLYTSFLNMKNNTLKTDLSVPKELDLQYPDNLDLISQLHANTIYLRSKKTSNLVSSFFNSSFIDVSGISLLLLDIKNEL